MRAILTIVSEPSIQPEIAALNRAIGLFPSVVAFASAVGVKESAPHMWRARGSVPAEWCPLIERVTRDKGHPVTCEELRPGVAWAVLREQAA